MPEPPIKVLHVVSRFFPGGTQYFVMNLYRATDQSRVQFDFVKHIPDPGPLEPEIRALGGTIYLCPRYNGKNLAAYCAWWDRFFKEHPEYRIVHGHVRSTAALYLAIAKRHGRITIAHSHSTSNGSGFSARIKNIMQLPLRFTADYLFACSDKAGAWLYGKSAAARPNYRMIPNGIDCARFAFDPCKRDEMRRTLGLDGHFTVGHIGRFSEPKNHGFLVDVFAQVCAADPEARLLLVGDGDGRPAIEEKCRALGLAGKVLFVGNQMAPQDYYQAMDVFLFPSLWEGLPVSVVEAQASGLPCFISDVITRDVVLTGLVHPLSLRESPAVWAGHLLGARRPRTGPTQAQREELRPFDMSQVAEDLTRFYLEAAAKE